MFNLICRILKINPYFPPINSRNPFKIWWYDRKYRKSYSKKVWEALNDPNRNFQAIAKKTEWGPAVGWKTRAEREGGIKPDKDGNAPSCQQIMSAESIKIEEIKHLKRMLEGSPACANKEDRAIYLDSKLEGDYKRLCVIHEILEIWLQGRVKHSKIDMIAIDIIEGLRNIGEIE